MSNSMSWNQTDSQRRHFERRWAINLAGDLLAPDDIDHGYVFAEAKATLDLDTCDSPRLKIWIHDVRRDTAALHTSATLPGQVDPHLRPDNLLRIAQASAAHLAKAHALMRAVNDGDDLDKRAAMLGLNVITIRVDI
jgi:hypothetical protein